MAVAFAPRVVPGVTDLIHQVTVAPAGVPADYNTDGVEDELEIEAAMRALSSQFGGGVVRVKGAMTLGRAVRISWAGITMEGDGVSSVLRLAATADDNVVTVTGDDCTIRMVKIDGNRGNIDADHHGISVSAARCRLRDLFVTDTVHHGIQSANSTDIEISHVWSQNTGKVGSNRDGVGIVIGAGQGPCIGARVSNCRVFNTGYHGFQVYRGSQHVQLVNCHAEQVGQTRDTGNSLEVHPGTSDVHVTNFIGIGTASGANGAGIVVDSEVGGTPSKSVTLASCVLDGHALSGIVVNGASEVSVIGGQIKNNGRSRSSSTTYGVRVKSGPAGDVPTHVHIHGVQFFDDRAAGSKTQTHPVAIFDGSTNVTVLSNSFSGHATLDSVLIDGSSTGTVTRMLNVGDTGDLLSTMKSRSHRKVHTDIVSLFADWMNLSSSVAATANMMYGYVMRVPRTGNLRDILVHFNAPSGNVAVSVYDVSAGGATRNRLYSSGSIATTGMAQGWSIVADPNLAVVEGQLICVCVAFDNATATMGRYNASLGSNSNEIPAAFAPEGNARMCCSKAAAFPDAGPTWTTPGMTTVPFGVVARIS